MNDRSEIMTRKVFSKLWPFIIESSKWIISPLSERKKENEKEVDFEPGQFLIRHLYHPWKGWRTKSSIVHLVTLSLSFLSLFRLKRNDDRESLRNSLFSLHTISLSLFSTVCLILPPTPITRYRNLWNQVYCNKSIYWFLAWKYSHKNNDLVHKHTFRAVTKLRLAKELGSYIYDHFMVALRHKNRLENWSFPSLLSIYSLQFKYSLSLLHSFPFLEFTLLE